MTAAKTVLVVAGKAGHATRMHPLWPAADHTVVACWRLFPRLADPLDMVVSPSETGGYVLLVVGTNHTLAERLRAVGLPADLATRVLVVESLVVDDDDAAREVARKLAQNVVADAPPINPVAPIHAAAWHTAVELVADVVRRNRREAIAS